MQWRLPNSSRRHSYTNPSTVSFSTMASGGNSSGSYENSLASTGGSSNRDRAFVQHPFGAGVAFDSPVRKTPKVKRNGSEGSVIRPLSQDVPATPSDPEPALTDSHYPSRLVMPTSNKMLREMQSFESTMTARQYDIIESETARGTPTADSSPWDKIDYHHLLDTYDDNPNLKRPPSAVWLKPGTTMAVVLNGGSGPSLPETPETDTTPLVDTAPSTPVVAPLSVSVINDDDDDQVIPVNDALRAFISHDEHIIPQDENEAAAGPSSRYTSTPDVFDVLQTYTGLPLLDRLPTGKRSTEGSAERGARGGVVVVPLKEVPDNNDDDDDDDLMVETTVIRMSLTTKEESAAPRDDPRFVIWGWVNDVVSKREAEEGVKKEKEKKKTRRSWRGSLLSGSEGDSPSDHEGSRKSRPSLGSKRRSRKDKIKAKQGATNEFGVVEDHPSNHNSQDEHHASDDTSLVPTSEGKRKVLIAATIERWVAQLTSEIDYDELLVFFLTYRTYVSATDLCRVLFGRFYWALRGGEDDGEDGGERTTTTTTSGNPKVCDDRVRRIVRVRTFVAIRYWLIQFWHVDFVPNRELRLLMADCLNQLNRDPLLKKHVDGLVRVFGLPGLLCS